jgi:integrase
MSRSELDGAVWTIPAARMKGKLDHVVPLSSLAQKVLGTLPVFDPTAGPVFTHSGAHPLSNYNRPKVAFDKQCGVSGWTIHDLRRTARSLMSRAGVPPDHAERALAHVIGGIRGIYDRHEFFEEKKFAFEALAAQIERILNPAPNVILLREQG